MAIKGGMVDAAPLVTLRRFFAALVLLSTLRFIANGWVVDQIIDPVFTFPFDGFEWLPRPSRWGATWLFGGMLLGGLGIAWSQTQRIGSALFFLCFTYVELLDKSNYLNHYYFVSLMALLLVFIPARNPRVPHHSILVVRGLICIVYFYAGLAKLNADWMLHAQPLAIWLPQHSSFPIIGPMFSWRETAFAFSWMGAAFDLMAPFALLSHRLRPWFYPVLVAFHVLTWLLFPIGVFPWVMIVCTTVFFHDDWHHRFWRAWGIKQLELSSPKPASPASSASTSQRKAIGKIAVGGFLAFQLLFPLRHLNYDGSVFWHEAGYRWSWRVMLMEKSGWATLFVVDQNGREQPVSSEKWLTSNQIKMMSTQPDMLVQFAGHVKEQWRHNHGQDVKVRAETWVSLNGRRSQLFIDPFADLASISNDWNERSFVIPLDSIIRPKQFHLIKDSLRHAKGWN
ncbi:MAG: HTTM domain-containing protein [Flavobacteriales bacterium]|nr:HTTM domain-containing protein [Flavobacteriales bacterium]